MKKEIVTIAVVGVVVVSIIFLEVRRSIHETPVTDQSAVTEGRYLGISSRGLQDLIRSKDPFVLIDLRMPVEYDGGHIAGAINIPVSSVEKYINNLDRRKEIILYCKSGPWSRQAYKILHEKGFNNVKVLENGIVGWKWEVNGEVVSTAPKNEG